MALDVALQSPTTVQLRTRLLPFLCSRVFAIKSDGDEGNGILVVNTYMLHLRPPPQRGPCGFQSKKHCANAVEKVAHRLKPFSQHRVTIALESKAKAAAVPGKGGRMDGIYYQIRDDDMGKFIPLLFLRGAFPDYDATAHGIFITTEKFERIATGSTQTNYQCSRAGPHPDDPFTQAYNNTKTRECDDVVRYLNAYGKHHLGEMATWSTISLSRDVATEVHHDYHNYTGTKNFTTSVGQRTGQWLPGRAHDTHNMFVEFGPFLKHATEPWTGSRWCVTYNTTRNLNKAGPEMLKFLKGCGFPLPRKQVLAGNEVKPTRKPRASTRSNIFNNAAKIGVMMATLITAAGSYMAEHFVPKADTEPIVIFEIGNTEATHEAASIGKDVFEPMSWEKYRAPVGKESAFHIANGGGPRELRVCLDGRPQQCGKALLDLVRLQIEDGGTVVINGPANDDILSAIDNDHFLKNTKRYQGDGEGKVFLVMFKEKPDTKPVVCHDRLHETKMVSRDSGPQPANGQLPMGAGGITFGEGTPGTVATAFRRLHQNLGHPRQEDLLRHLRLAGCDPSVVKAARSMKCQVCNANAGPKIARPSTLPPVADFNDTLGLDLFFCHDTNDEKHGFLLVVDYGTTYHLAVKVDGQSAQNIEAKFNEMCLLPFRPPKAVVIDLEGGLQSALGRLCDWHGIGVRSVAAQSHWQAGVVERQQAWWKHIWDKVSYQLSITEDEVELAVPIINGSYESRRPSRLPPEPDCRKTSQGYAAAICSVHGRRGCWTGPAVIVGKEGRSQKEMERLLDHDPDGDEAYEDDEQEYLEGLVEDISLPGEDDKVAEADDEDIALDVFDDIAAKVAEPPGRLGEALTEILPEVHAKFREAEKTQWEQLSFDALEPLSISESERIPAERILRSRWAYKHKKWSKRHEGEDVPWKCKSRLIIAGHTDPDLTDESLTLSTADPWTLAAGDIRCAFLTGSYLDRELYMHQPKTGFPGMTPGQLVRIKKNVFVGDGPMRVPTEKVDGESFEGLPIAYLGCHVDDLLVAGPRGLQGKIQEALAAKFEIFFHAPFYVRLIRKSKSPCNLRATGRGGWGWEGIVAEYQVLLAKAMEASKESSAPAKAAGVKESKADPADAGETSAKQEPEEAAQTAPQERAERRTAESCSGSDWEEVRKKSKKQRKECRRADTDSAERPQWREREQRTLREQFVQLEHEIRGALREERALQERLSRREERPRRDEGRDERPKRPERPKWRDERPERRPERGERSERRGAYDRPERRSEVPDEGAGRRGERQWREERPARRDAWREERPERRRDSHPSSRAAGAQSSADDSRGSGRARRETYTAAPLHTPLDSRRGGAVTKIAILIGAYESRNERELTELSERFDAELAARTERVLANSWAEKLRRMVTAVLQDQTDALRAMVADFRRARPIQDAIQNRSWKEWRQRGYD
ncbi:unnamed protein product [Symbiodinium sp. CCMP2592]|nr:unnamed protein product [Symbiodinium sp. CCMP2592]